MKKKNGSSLLRSENIIRRHPVIPAKRNDMLHGDLIDPVFVTGIDLLGRSQNTRDVLLAQIVILPELADYFIPFFQNQSPFAWYLSVYFIVNYYNTPKGMLCYIHHIRCKIGFFRELRI